MAEQNVETKSRKEEPTGQRSLARHDPFFHMDPAWSPSRFFATSPFALMRGFAENLERAFGGDTNREGSPAWSPAIDVSQQGDRLIVRADLPGLNPEDVKVETVDDNLVIHGERHQEREEKEGGYRRLERHYGSFYRSIPLPEGAKVEQARAQFKNGVLEIAVPVAAAQRKGREIPIEGAATPERKELTSAGTNQTRVSKAG